jgi:hypothetical protein
MSLTGDSSSVLSPLWILWLLLRPGFVAPPKEMSVMRSDAEQYGKYQASRIGERTNADAAGRLFCAILPIRENLIKGPSTLAFFASVSASVMAPLPNSFLCFFTYVIARQKNWWVLGGGASADGTTDAKTASVDGP